MLITLIVMYVGGMLPVFGCCLSVTGNSAAGWWPWWAYLLVVVFWPAVVALLFPLLLISFVMAACDL